MRPSRGRSLFVNRDRLRRPEVQEFLRFYLSQTAEIVATVGYVPLPAVDYAENRTAIERLVQG